MRLYVHEPLLKKVNPGLLNIPGYNVPTMCAWCRNINLEKDYDGRFICKSICLHIDKHIGIIFCESWRMT